MCTVSMIWAQGINQEIGLNNGLPWSIPEDLKYFKDITNNSVVVMGRSTWESLPKGLPGRVCVVISKSKNLQHNADNCTVVNSIEAALTYAKSTGKSEVFVIGGASIYKQLYPFVNKLYITKVHHSAQADCYFPISTNTIEQEFRIETQSKVQCNESWYLYHFETWVRVPSEP